MRHKHVLNKKIIRYLNYIICKQFKSTEHHSVEMNQNTNPPAGAFALCPLKVEAVISQVDMTFCKTEGYDKEVEALREQADIKDISEDTPQYQHITNCITSQEHTPMSYTQENIAKLEKGDMLSDEDISTNSCFSSAKINISKSYEPKNMASESICYKNIATSSAPDSVTTSDADMNSQELHSGDTRKYQPIAAMQKFSTYLSSNKMSQTIIPEMVLKSVSDLTRNQAYPKEFSARMDCEIFGSKGELKQQEKQECADRRCELEGKISQNICCVGEELDVQFDKMGCLNGQKENAYLKVQRSRFGSGDVDKGSDYSIGLNKEEQDIAKGLQEEVVDILPMIDVKGILKDSKPKPVDTVFNLSLLFSGELEKRRKSELKRAKLKAAALKKRGQEKGRCDDSKDGKMEPDDDGKKKGGRTTLKKPIPNYFIAVQIPDQQVHASVKTVQEAVVTGNPLLKSTLVGLPTIHLTVLVLSLSTQEDIDRSKTALETAMDMLQTKYSKDLLLLNIQGVSHFRHQVVFACIPSETQQMALVNMAEVVNECFTDHGIISPDKRGFKPHVTIMKLSKGKGLRQKGIKKIEESLYSEYKEMDFGQQFVTSLQLCAMGKRQKSGYYHVEHEVFFPAASNMETSVAQPSESIDTEATSLQGAGLFSGVQSINTTRQLDAGPITGAQSTESLTVNTASQLNVSPVNGVPSEESIDGNTTRQLDAGPISGAQFAESIHVNTASQMDVDPIYGVPSEESIDGNTNRQLEAGPISGVPSTEI